jgi:tetratricopeptide (TPR) repeat protein
VTTRAILLGLLAAAACATSAPGAQRPPAAPARGERSERAAHPERADASAREAAREATPPGALPARTQRLFDEAVRAEEEQKKLKVPPDWPYLERKWRAVLDAEEVAEARFNLGVALEAQGKLGDARAEYERAREAKPSLHQAAANLGVLLERQGDARAAAAVYQGVVRDFPEDSVARERLAELYRAAGQTEDAWRLAREALVRDPRSLVAYKVLAQVAIQRNDLDLAKLVALRAQKLDPRDPELPFLVGEVLARQGDDPGAAVQFRRALALREGFLPARHALLAAALKGRLWSGVAEHAAALLAQAPDDAGLQLTHGIALRHLGKPDEALAAYARAEKLSGEKLPEVHLARGVLLARVKSECEPALAELAAYRRAVPVVPDAAQVTKVQRDCERMLEENRKALEAAKQMEIEARQAAEKAAKQGRTAPAEGSAPPTSAPVPAR